MYQKALLSIDFSECPHCQFFMVQREQVTGSVYHSELEAELALNLESPWQLFSGSDFPQCTLLLPYTTFKFKSLSTTSAAAKSLQSCPTLCDPIEQPTKLPLPWDFPGKNTGVGCHFLLPCMKVKSEREVAQWCPTLSDPMDCRLPGSSVHRIFQARVLEWGAIAFYTLGNHF